MSVASEAEAGVILFGLFLNISRGVLHLWLYWSSWDSAGPHLLFLNLRQSQDEKFNPCFWHHLFAFKTGQVVDLLPISPGCIERAASFLQYLGDSFKFSFYHINSGDNNVLNCGEIINRQLILPYLLTRLIKYPAPLLTALGLETGLKEGHCGGHILFLYETVFFSGINH